RVTRCRVPTWLTCVQAVCRLTKLEPGTERQLEPRSRPANRDQTDRARARNPGIAHVGTAEADTGRHDVGHRRVLVLAGRLEHGDTTVPQRRDADFTAGFERKAVEPFK